MGQRAAPTDLLALLAHPGATLESIRTVHSHPQALSQAESTITRHGWDAQPEHDTAGAVRLVAERGDPAEACAQGFWLM